MTSTSMAGRELDRRLRNQLETWRRDLLNLDRRQKLVYFKHTRTASFEIAYPSPGEIFRALGAGVPIHSMDVKTDGRSLLVSEKTTAEVAAGCRRLDLTAQQVFADRGFWTLYVGLGMLEWIDPSDGKTAYAPIVLVPVDLKRTSTQSPYQVVRNDDDVVVNPALRLHLEREFSITLPDLDIDDPDLTAVLGALAHSTASRPGWSVQERAVLTTFSFHKEAIYRDLTDHESTILHHPIVQLVALGADAPSAGSFGFEVPGRDAPIDEVFDPEDLVSILDADSSQRACILAAREGHSFVMDGPPGTGKSQTIANIVAELVAAGRRVLFVSEKAAALDVVRDRLGSKGLGDFLLELHSHSATRKEVVKQLDEALAKRVKPKGAMNDGDRALLRATRTELTQFADAMNVRRTGMDHSVYAALGKLLPLNDHAHAPLPNPEDWRQLSRTDFDQLISAADGLSKAWRPVLEGDDFLWRDLRERTHSGGEVLRLRTTTAELLGAVTALVDRVRAVDESLALAWPIDATTTAQRISLLELLETRPSLPVDWLSHDDFPSLRRRVVRLREAVGFHNVAQERLLTMVGSDRADDIDPDRCGRLADEWDASAVWEPPQDATNRDLRSAHDLLAVTPVDLAAVLEDTRLLCGMLGVSDHGMTLTRAVEVANLAMLGGAAAQPERAWLNPAVQAALDESLRVLSSVVEVVNGTRSSIEQVFTAAALDADLAGLEVRFRETHTGMRAWGGPARRDRQLLKSITVSGKADKAVRARLTDAVAWQKAEQQLAASEKTHADRLGDYWQGASTDFGRISDAISTARRAIELAGNDLNGGRMGDQLSRDGHPDPRLTVIAHRVLDGAARWTTAVRTALGSSAGLDSLPLDVAASRAQSVAVVLAPLLDAADHVADVAGRDVTLAEARLIRQEALALNDALVAIYDSYDADRELLGEDYEGLTTDWSRLDLAGDWVEKVHAILGGPALPRQAESLFSPVVLADDLRSRFDEYRGTARSWTAAFAKHRARTLQRDIDADLVAGGELVADMLGTCTTDVDEWDAHVLNTGVLVHGGLGETVHYLKRTRASAIDVRPSIEWAVLQAWLEGTITYDSRLTTHRAVEREARVQKFAGLDQDLIARANVSVAAACSARRPASLTGASAQLIRRESQKKSRHLPIRDLLARTREIVQELKPCFMMSPLSVSQFLPGDMTFDVVIFDEASQVLPSDAVNCIYRGAQLIVAGDEKQLPPTSFFAQAVSEEDVDEELDLFESVLKSCKSSLPSLPLTWHYRSQHESLITFSNHAFYEPDGQSLQTFPSAAFTSPDLGVESYIVNGVYRRGTTRDNAIEAEAVVDRLLFHREHHPDLSIGVVTFSSAQENAISDAVERRSATEPALAGLLDNHDRLSGFFVKNLENVQGDERDIIIFSIGYGPDDEGDLRMNFGPVIREGGWRRLNVAITRARRRVEVVSSFHASQIREGSNKSLGHLKSYLDFAARGTASLGLTDEEPLDSGGPSLEDDVLQAVRSWGYDVDRSVGNSDYRLDLAVRHPDREGAYAIAIECDGEAYVSASSARDRDRLRTGVLRGLGWELHRVWGIAWYRDRAQESARLRAAIERAIVGDSGPSALPAPTSVPLEVDEVDFDAPPSWAVPYRLLRHSPLHMPYALSAVEARPQLHDYVAKLVRTEGPVHQDVVFRRIRDAFGAGRIGANIKANIEFVATRVSIDGVPVMIDGSGFYRHSNAVAVRVPADENEIRTVAQTPPEELELAVYNVVVDAVVVNDEDLVLAVRNIFGWRRAGSDIQVGVLNAVDRCVRNGRLVRTDGGALRST